MLKREELEFPTSCLNKAADDEPIFVLRAKDPCAPAAILAWANNRITQGIDTAGSSKIAEAIQIGRQMEEWQKRQARKVAGTKTSGSGV